MQIKTLEDAEVVLTAARKILTKKAHQPLNEQVDLTLADELLTEITNRMNPFPINEVAARLLLQELGIAIEGEESNDGNG